MTHFKTNNIFNLLNENTNETNENTIKKVTKKQKKIYKKSLTDVEKCEYKINQLIKQYNLIIKVKCTTNKAKKCAHYHQNKAYNRCRYNKDCKFGHSKEEIIMARQKYITWKRTQIRYFKHKINQETIYLERLKYEETQLTKIKNGKKIKFLKINISTIKDIKKQKYNKYMKKLGIEKDLKKKITWKKFNEIIKKEKLEETKEEEQIIPTRKDFEKGIIKANNKEFKPKLCEWKLITLKKPEPVKIKEEKNKLTILKLNKTNNRLETLNKEITTESTLITYKTPKKFLKKQEEYEKRLKETNPEEWDNIYGFEKDSCYNINNEDWDNCDNYDEYDEYDEYL